MQMAWIYILILIVAGFVSFFLNYATRKFALGHNLVQKVRNRDVHKKPIPRLGGLAIFISFWLVALGILLVAPGRLWFTDATILGIDRNLFGVLLGGLVIASVMLIDDLRGLNWGWKLASQFLAAAVVAVFGVTTSWLQNPFDSLIHLDKVAFVLGNFNITWGHLFVIFWIVLVMNVVNWLDGIDGLASGIVMIAAIAIFLLSISPRIDQPATAILAVILVGSLIGFMPFNFNPAKMFLGDVGSMFIGYMLAVLSVISGGKVATASLVMGIPLLDGIWVIGNRLIHHKSPFQADQSHIHHRLMKAGLSVKQTVIVLYAGSMIFGYLALRSGTEGKFWALIWLVGVMLFLSIGLIVLEWVRGRKNIRREHE